MPSVDASPQELFESLRTPVRAFLGRVLRDDERVDEAAAETWLALLERHRRRFRPRDWTAYALRVAWSQALRVQRRHRAARGESAPSDAAVDGAPDPRRLVELRELLERSFGMLAPVDRALLHLRFERDAGHAEIARIMGWPKGTVKRRIHEARRRLLVVFERLGVERANLALCALWPLAGDGPKPPTGGVSQAHPLARYLAGGALAAALAVGVAPGAGRPGPASPLMSAPPPEPSAAPAAFVAPSPQRVVEAAAARAADASVEAPRPRSGRRVAGSVLDLQGRPVAGAAVRIAGFVGGERVVRSTTTDGAGRYALDAIHDLGAAWDDGRPDDSVLEVRAPGFAAAWRRLATVPRPSDGGPRNLDVFVGRPGVLSGVVHDAETGAPLAGASVVLWANLAMGTSPAGLLFAPRDPVGPTVLAETRAGPDGRYELAAVPTRAAGVPPRPRHTPEGAAPLDPLHGGLTVSADGYAPRPWMVRLPGGEGERVTLDPGLLPAGAVVGRVVDAEGRPRAGAVVEAGIDGLTTHHYRAFAAQSPAGVPWRATTDAAGRYEIPRLPCRRSGPTLVRLVVADGGAAVEAEVRAGTSLRAPDLTCPAAAPEDAPRRADSAAPAPAWIAGRVVDRDGAPVEGVLVVGVPAGVSLAELSRAPAGAGETVLRRAVSGPHGRYRLEGLAACEVALCVAVPRPGGAPLSVGDLERVGESETLRDDVELRLAPRHHAPRGTVELRVKSAADGAAPRRGLRAWLAGDGDGDGAAALVFGPGRLLLRDVPAGARRAVVEAEGYQREEVVLVVPPGVAAAPVPVVLRPGFAVRGRVVRPAGLPESVAPGVIAERGSPPETVQGTVAPDGTFEVSGLEAGSWRIVAYARDRRAGRAWSSPPRTIELVSASHEGDLAVELTPLDTLEVRLEGVEAATGAAPDDAFLRVSYSLCRTLRMVVRDASGRVWFDRPPYAFGGGADGADWVLPVPLPRGSYTVSLHRDDGATLERAARVPGEIRFDVRRSDDGDP